MNEKNLSIFIDEHSYRYEHILGVVEEMRFLLAGINIEEKTKKELIESCFLLDIGYSEKLMKTGYHPLDGALYCKEQNYSKEVIAAVLFHTGAMEDVRRNFPDLLNTYLEYHYFLSEKEKLYIDLVTYCDLHRSSYGQKVTLEERMNEIFISYGINHIVSQTMITIEPSFRETIARVKTYINEHK